MESFFNYLEMADEFLLTGFLLLTLITICIAGLVFTIAITGGILGWCGDKWNGR